uniref:non-specific serine/threonine protein kinase n=1 Tax=Opuntia streptacantha TaxID=393608 RepID=A0A7C9EWS3_OPUST
MTSDTLSRSSVSTTTSDISTSLNPPRSRNRVKSAAKVVAGAFITCFTPPEDDEPCFKKQDGFQQLKAPPVSSGTRGSRQKRCSTPRSYNSTLEGAPGSMKFTMAQIYKATSNFSPSLKIGQGGFGTVYKATLEDGTLVAVKRAKRVCQKMTVKRGTLADLMCENWGMEFQSEIQTLTKVEHLNLVKLYGFLEEEDERILVVEYVSNGSLREHLEGIRGHALDMAARLDIAIDVAHAITYLHMYTDNPIIHRDIKSSNILLTEKRRAKVADFGFARLVTDSDLGATHVCTQVKGTAGYLDPEYLKTYQLTEKSDVYSFGVLLVELITGRRPIETKRTTTERVTPKWAITKFSEGDAVSTMDPKLEATTANCAALKRTLELAFICLAPQRQNRPTMKRCAEMLWSIRKDYKELLASDSCSLSPGSRKRSVIQEY